MGRVAKGGLKLLETSDAAEFTGKPSVGGDVIRKWGGKGLRLGNAGRPSHRCKPTTLRRRILNLIKKIYSGSEAKRFGAILVAENMAKDEWDCG